MKSEAAKQVEDLLQDARTLAYFSNLNDADADYFRNNYPDFIPQVWWRWQVGTNRKLWKEWQQTLRDAWQAGLPLEQSVRLISAGTMADTRPDITENWEPAAQPNYIAPNAIVIPASSPLVVEIEPDMWIKSQVWPYQRAVMFLHTVPWRARHCTVCLKRFVAAEPKQGVCSEECRQEAERRRKRVWWNKSGNRWRKKQRRAK